MLKYPEVVRQDQLQVFIACKCPKTYAYLSGEQLNVLLMWHVKLEVGEGRRYKLGNEIDSAGVSF